jgi:hypothetical protein
MRLPTKLRHLQFGKKQFDEIETELQGGRNRSLALPSRSGATALVPLKIARCRASASVCCSAVWGLICGDLGQAQLGSELRFIETTYAAAVEALDELRAYLDRLRRLVNLCRSGTSR